MNRTHPETGFSLIELIVAMGVLLAVSSIVTTALMQMTNAQATIWNRTEMHSGIRGATELLQQEVGQAGRISLPGVVTLGAAVAATAGCDPASPAAPATTVTVTSIAGMYAVAGPPASYIMLTTMDGDASESIKVGAILTTPARITACFSKAHLAGTVLVPMGGFATGIVPPLLPDGAYTGYPNGSTDTKLKLYGDINGDGEMVYVEYTCDTIGHKLYRQVMQMDLDPLPAKEDPTDADLLLNNIQLNPGGTPCFQYQKSTMLVQGTAFTFVLDVAITLTVQTEQIDPLTRQYQQETKALLNVSPRNVFNAWSLASIGYTDRIQSTPISVITLLPEPL